MTRSTAVTLNALGLYAVALVLAAAFAAQLLLQELPCPLCLLQRIEFLRDQIAPHKIPVFWTFTDGLPMTPTGKTQKFVLRQQAAEGTLTFDEGCPSKSVTQL